MLHYLLISNLVVWYAGEFTERNRLDLQQRFIEQSLTHGMVKELIHEHNDMALTTPLLTFYNYVMSDRACVDQWATVLRQNYLDYLIRTNYQFNTGALK
jgi:hypothetical protein